MWSKLPTLVAVLCTVSALQAQEASPTPSATPAVPAASPTPEQTSTAAAPEATPASVPEATPGASAAPVEGAPMVQPSDVTPSSAKPDVIPMEGQPAATSSGTNAPDAGAPLETKDIAPAMPDDAFTKPNAVIPDESTPQAPAAPQTAESAQEKARQISIHYQEVRVTAEKDPKVVAMMAKANAAKTEEDQRAALREYYKLLFKKISTIDPSLTQKCNDLMGAYERRLAQYRLEPTIPLNPPPTPEPLASH